jgi:hypothetical protein
MNGSVFSKQRRSICKSFKANCCANEIIPSHVCRKTRGGKTVCSVECFSCQFNFFLPPVYFSGQGQNPHFGPLKA